MHRGMSAFDPYAVLGVARTATPTAIKSAYRLKAQQFHPDRGGDADAFILVVQAFGILSDPEARRLFDEAGIVDTDAVDAHRREVTKILADMFDAAVAAAVSTGLDLGRVDFIAQMSLAVERAIMEARLALRSGEGEIRAIETLRARIRRKDADRNLFADRLDSQLAGKAEVQAGTRRRMLLLETAKVELGNYRTEVELIAALEAD